MQIVNKKGILFQNNDVMTTLLGLDSRPFEPSVVPGTFRHKGIKLINEEKQYQKNMAHFDKLKD